MRFAFTPVEKLSLYFIALLAVIALAGSAVIPHSAWLIARFGLILLSLCALALHFVRPNSNTYINHLRMFLPIAIIPILFDSLGDIIPWLWPHYVDDVLIKIDYGIFGVHPSVWMERMVHPLLTNTLQFAYISYYGIPISLGITLVVKNRKDAFIEAIFGIVLCFYLSYIGYLLFPAVGPRFTLAHLQTTGLQAGHLTTSIQNTLNGLENTKTDAFPSGHTAVALMTLYYAWKFKEQVLTRILAPLVIALIFSTVYLRYHYVIDVIAGILLTLITIRLAPVTYALLARGQDRET